MGEVEPQRAEPPLDRNAWRHARKLRPRERDPHQRRAAPLENAQYEAATPAAKDIYLKVREYYSKNFEERKKILLDAANRAKAAGKNTSEVERMFAKVKGPYFPLMRIGGWYKNRDVARAGRSDG